MTTTRKGAARTDNPRPAGRLLRSWACLAGVVSLAYAQSTPPPPATTPPPATDPAPAPTHTPPIPPPPPSSAPAQGPVAAPDDESPIEPGLEVEVVLQDGRRVVGLLVEQQLEKVVVSINGIVTSFPMAEVNRVQVRPDASKIHEDMRRAIPDEDAERHLQLARWAFDRRLLALALMDVDHVLELEPGNADAKQLRVLIIEQQKLLDAQRKATPGGGAIPNAGGDRPKFPLLSREQINLMRVFEIDLKDPPRMIIDRDTVRRFLDKYAGRQVEGLGPVPVGEVPRALFMRQKPADILAWMFALKAREFYPEIQVQENPRAMRTFIRDVHANWLVNTCATSQCHGGEEAGRLWLDNRAPQSDEAAYTNFLILERFRTENNLPLINYDRPEESVLLSFGLPSDEALWKHPEVTGKGRPKWRPAFPRGRQDEKYQRTLDWIRSMYTPREELPVTYEPPKPRAARPTVKDR